MALYCYREIKDLIVMMFNNRFFLTNYGEDGLPATSSTGSWSTATDSLEVNDHPTKFGQNHNELRKEPAVAPSFSGVTGGSNKSRKLSFVIFILKLRFVAQ